MAVKSVVEREKQNKRIIEGIEYIGTENLIIIFEELDMLLQYKELEECDYELYIACVKECHRRDIPI